MPGAAGPQTQLAATPTGLIEILALALRASAAESQARKDKEFAKLVLSCTKDGQYGGYNLSHGQDGEIDDTAAMREILTGLGVEIPKKSKTGPTYVKLVR